MSIEMAHHNERGTANSTLLTAWDLGVGLGILLGGVLAELYDYGAAFWSMVVVHIMGVAVYFFMVRQSYTKHKIPPL